MRILFYFILFSFFLFVLSCKENASLDNEKKEMETFSKPRVYPLNLEEGYIIDPLTGDSLLPSVNSVGGAVATGEQIRMSGKVFDKSSFFTLKAVQVINPKVFPAHSNIHRIPENLAVKPVDTNSIKSNKTNQSSLQTLLNSLGDTIITNIPIEIKGETLNVTKPNVHKALKPSVKENAIEDIEFYNLEHGMSSPYVQAMIQDRRGHIWIATYGGGVNEFNGNEFIHLSKNEGLKSNVIMSMMEDSKGNIWFGTLYNGLIKYDGKHLTHYSEKEGLSNNSIFSMVERSDGSIWFGTMGSGVIKYENQKFTNYTIKEGLQGLTINALIEDKKGNLLIGSEEFGFCIYNDETFTQYSTNEGLLNKEVTALLEDKNGYIWIGTRSHGLFRFKDEYFVQFSVNEGLSSNDISSLLEDKKGNIWISTLDKGVNKFNGNAFKHFTANEGLNSNKIQSILEDSYGNLWFGTYNGVCIYNPNSFRHFSENEGFSVKSARSIYEAKNGDIWFGTNGRGVIKYDGISFTHYGEKEGFCNNGSDVWSIEEDKNGNFWFATIPDGIFKYDGNYFTNYKCKEPFSNQVISFNEDKNGNFWVASDSRGIGHFNGEYFIHFTDEKGLLHNDIFSIFEDSQGNLWINSEGGGVSKISIMKDASSIDSTYVITHYSGKEGFTSSTISEIMEDSEGNIWFGTPGYGLIKFDGMSFTYYNEQDGISTNGIISMIEDRSGRIWIGTSDGLECLLPNPDSLGSLNSIEDGGLDKFQVRSFGTMDGLKARNFLNSSLVDKNNCIWWSIGSGLTMLDLNTFEFSETIPRLQLSQLKINNQRIDYQNDEEISKLDLKFDSVPKFYNYPLNLKLPYFNNQLTFYFSAMDGASSHNIKYSFKMEGLEDTWSHPSSESKIEYRNLPYGNFTLKIKAIGAAHKWSKTLEYTFVIYPPWWHTWWARIIYGLLFIALIILIVHLRTRSLLKRQKLLQKSEEKYRGVFDSITDVFLRADIEGNCLLISPSIFNVLGYTVEEVMDKNISMFYTNPKNRDELLKKLKEKGSLQNYEVKLYKKDGSIIIGSTNTRFVYETDGNPFYIESIFRDITEKKKMTEELRASEEKFKILVTNTEEIIYMIAKDGTFLLSEGKGLEKLGLKGGDVVGKSVYDIYKDFPEMLEKIRLAFKGETVIMEHEIGDIHFKSWYTPHLDQEGEVIGLLGLSINITEQKLSEIKILEYQKRLRDLATDLTLTEEKVRKQIAGDLHDNVGQLLTSSRMQLSTINDEMDKFEVSKKIKNISKALLQANQATREAIFNLSPPQLHEIGLYAAIHDWMKEQVEIKYGIKTTISGIKERFNLDENTRYLLFRSVRELMINVTKHARAAHLDIETNSKNDMLEIMVRDDGVGFDYNSKLFRLKSKSYGLFSIQERISDLGGSMKITSTPGFGTKIKLSIPLRMKE